MKATQIQNGGLVPESPRHYRGPTRPKWVRLAEKRKREGKPTAPRNNSKTNR